MTKELSENKIIHGEYIAKDESLDGKTIWRMYRRGKSPNIINNEFSDLEYSYWRERRKNEHKSN